MKLGRLVRGLVIATLVLLTFGVLGVTSSAASEWKINGVKLTKEEEFYGLQLTTDFLFSFEGVNLLLDCKVKIWGSSVILPSGELRGSYEYRECVAFEKASKKELSKCKPESFVFKFKAHLILHKSKTYLLFEPLEGGSFGTMKFPELCAITEGGKVSGSYVMECLSPESCEEEKLIHAFIPASTSLFTSDILKFGTHVMGWTGQEAMEPIGAGIGKPWAAFG